MDSLLRMFQYSTILHYEPSYSIDEDKLSSHAPFGFILFVNTP